MPVRSRCRAVRAIDVRCAHVGVVVNGRILCEEYHTNAFEIGPNKYRVIGHRRLNAWFWPRIIAELMWFCSSSPKSQS